MAFMGQALTSRGAPGLKSGQGAGGALACCVMWRVRGEPGDCWGIQIDRGGAVAWVGVGRSGQ